jgi:hypothetical protein
VPTVKHPTFQDVTEEVSVKDLPDWLEQGWLSDQVTEPVPVVDVTPKPGPRNK